MITAQEALNFEPQKAGMNGYRAVEVDRFAEAVAETLDFQEKKIRDLQNKIAELKQNETIIQTTLVNAQKLAMQITEEAKAKAQQITDEATEKANVDISQAQQQSHLILSDAKNKAQQLTDESTAVADKLDGETRDKAARIINEAKAESERIRAQTEADIAHENKILDAIKSEVAKFRADILNMYKEQVTLIRDLPDMMPEELVFVSTQMQTQQESADVSEEPVADGAGGDLLKLMSDMKANEQRAAEAIDEVASMSAEPTVVDEAAQQEDAATQSTAPLQFSADEAEEDEDDDIPVMPVIKRDGGFTVSIDDDDE